jgi:hypothetical protein
MDNETRKDIAAEINERSHGDVPLDPDEIIEMAEDIGGDLDVDYTLVLAVWIQEAQAAR